MTFIRVEKLDLSAENDEELNKFYARQYLADVLKIPGLVNARHYRLIRATTPTPKHLFFIESTNLDSLVGENSKHDLIPRWDKKLTEHFQNYSSSIYEQFYALGKGTSNPDLASKYAMMVSTDVTPSEAEDAWNQWYNTQHLCMLLAVPGLVNARRFRLVKGEARKYIAFYNAESFTFFESERHLRARETEEAKKMLPHFKNLLYNFFEFIDGIKPY